MWGRIQRLFQVKGHLNTDKQNQITAKEMSHEPLIAPYIMSLFSSRWTQELFDCAECWLHCKHEHCLHILPVCVIKSRPLTQGVNTYLLVRRNNGSLFHKRVLRKLNRLTQGTGHLWGTGSAACAQRYSAVLLLDNLDVNETHLGSFWKWQ